MRFWPSKMPIIRPVETPPGRFSDKIIEICSESVKSNQTISSEHRNTLYMIMYTKSGRN